MLWEACCIPSLLHGAGTWVEMSTKTLNKLNSIQNWFLRLVLQVGPGAPVAALLWDARVLDMQLRVWREKLMLILHVRRLSDTSLAKQIYEEQRKNNWPGLAEETEKICGWLDIESVHATLLDVQDYREVVTEACHRVNEQRLREISAGKEKTVRIENEVYEKKEYFSKKKN